MKNNQRVGGLAIVVAFPFAIVLLLASLIGIPLGLVLLLASGLLVFVGYAWSSWTAGRLILRPPRNRLLAYLLGWSILSAAALVPFIGVTTWIAGVRLEKKCRRLGQLAKLDLKQSRSQT